MIYIYRSMNGSEPPVIDIPKYAGIYLQGNNLKFSELRDKYKEMYWGAYWVFNPISNQATEAYNFSNLINGNAGTLPPSIQVLLSGQLNWNNIITQLSSFFTEFKRWYKKPLIFETNLSTWNALYKFPIPSIIDDAPLLLWGTPSTGFTHPIALLSHDDNTIDFDGTKEELLVWTQTYILPTPSNPTILTDSEKLDWIIQKMNSVFK